MKLEPENNIIFLDLNIKDLVLTLNIKFWRKNTQTDAIIDASSNPSFNVKLNVLMSKINYNLGYNTINQKQRL